MTLITFSINCFLGLKKLFLSEAPKMLHKKKALQNLKENIPQNFHTRKLGEITIFHAVVFYAVRAPGLLIFVEN